MQPEHFKTGFGRAEPILALHTSVSLGWFRISIVTTTRFATVGIKAKPKLQFAVMRQLRDGHVDPVEVLKKYAPLFQPPRVVTLSDVKSMEWYEKSDRLVLRTRCANDLKHRKTKAVLGTSDARKKSIDAILRVAGEFTRSEEPAGIRYAGQSQICFIVTVLVMFLSIGIVGLLFPDAKMNTIEVGWRPGRGWAFLYELLGPAGMIATGLMLSGAAMFSWFRACKNAPVKYVVTAQCPKWRKSW